MTLPPYIDEAAAEIRKWEEFGAQHSWLDGLARGELRSAWGYDQHAVPENPAVMLPEDLGRMAEDRRTFRVIVPLSGGLDSSTLWLMAQEAGLPAQPVYVDAGQEYAVREYQSACEIAQAGIPRIPVPAEGKRFKHIIAGRNARIIHWVAAWASYQDWWGQIWLGNLAGESPATGGDKSARFLGTMQAILHDQGRDFHLLSPLCALDKPDLIRWWHDHDRANLLPLVKPCFDADKRRCGRCQSCFRFFVAIVGSGMYDLRGGNFAPFMREWFGEGWDFAASVEKYLYLMTSEANPYNARRTRDTLLAIDLLTTHAAREAMAL